MSKTPLNMPSAADVRVIDGWPDCVVSRDGRVWRNGKEKAISLSAVGYKVVQRSEGNKTKSKYMHRVLMEAFVGPPPDGCEVLHINGDPLDNRLENLRWGTRRENVADSVRHGTATIGVKNIQAKFNEADVRSIHRLRAKGIKSAEIALRFGVTKNTVNNLLSGRTYKGVSA